MPVRLGRFEMPKRLQKDEASATETYAKFIADPFETGYGHTVGNSLRRVLLSSLEGAAITSLKVDGAMHEFATVDGVHCHRPSVPSLRIGRTATHPLSESGTACPSASASPTLAIVGPVGSTYMA